jgi:hypothetical protein
MRFLKVFGAGVVVYVAMAACAAESKQSGPSSSSSGSSSGSAGGTTSSGSLVDVLVNPVPDARAAPESATEKCDKSYQNGASTTYYAEHSYPGVSAGELATSVATLLEKGSAFPSGYQNIYSVSGWVRDGAVAVNCVSGQNVTFVRRQ